VDAPLPAFPPDYQEVASAQLGCSVHDFYLRFICGESPFMRNFHVEVRRSPCASTAWAHRRGLTSPSNARDTHMRADREAVRLCVQRVAHDDGGQ